MIMGNSKRHVKEVDINWTKLSHIGQKNRGGKISKIMEIPCRGGVPPQLEGILLLPIWLHFLYGFIDWQRYTFVLILNAEF